MADFADTVFVDGWIFSAPQDAPVRADVAVADGRIMAVGTAEEIAAGRGHPQSSRPAHLFRRVDESADASADHQL